MTIQTLLARARLDLQQDQLDSATRVIDELLLAVPSDPAVRCLESRLHLSRGRPEMAAEAARAALQQAPGDSEALTLRARALHRTGAADSAAVCAELALAAGAWSGEAGDMALEVGLYPQAAAIFLEFALQTLDDQTECHRLLGLAGVANHRAGAHDLAVTQLAAARPTWIRLANEELVVLQCRSLLALGRIDEAWQALPVPEQLRRDPHNRAVLRAHVEAAWATHVPLEWEDACRTMVVALGNDALHAAELGSGMLAFDDLTGLSWLLVGDSHSHRPWGQWFLIDDTGGTSTRLHTEDCLAWSDLAAAVQSMLEPLGAVVRGTARSRVAVQEAVDAIRAGTACRVLAHDGDRLHVERVVEAVEVDLHTVFDDDGVVLSGRQYRDGGDDVTTVDPTRVNGDRDAVLAALAHMLGGPVIQDPALDDPWADEGMGAAS